MAMSNSLESSILNHILTASSYSSPNGSLHLALFTADPTDAFIPSTEVDDSVDDTAYARQPIHFDSAAIDVDSGFTESVSNDIQTFAAVVYGSGAIPYNITHFAILDALTGGNLLFHAPLSGVINRVVGKTLVFDAGVVNIILN